MFSFTKYSCKDKFITYPFLTNIGMKQGDCLIPTPFNIFQPELDNVPVDHLFFADDIILLSTKKMVSNIA